MPLTQFRLTNMFERLDLSSLTAQIRERCDWLQSTGYLDTGIEECYGVLAPTPDLACHQHSMHCRKYLDHSGTEEKTGFDCPMVHPDLFRQVMRQHGLKADEVAYLKTGITCQGMDGRYSPVAAWMSTYRHKFQADIYLRYALEAYYLKRTHMLLPPLFHDRDLHTECVIVKAIPEQAFLQHLDLIKQDAVALGVWYVPN
jgi:hypothetical protein